MHRPILFDSTHISYRMTRKTIACGAKTSHTLRTQHSRSGRLAFTLAQKPPNATATLRQHPDRAPETRARTDNNPVTVHRERVDILTHRKLYSKIDISGFRERFVRHCEPPSALTKEFCGEALGAGLRNSMAFISQ